MAGIRGIEGIGETYVEKMKQVNAGRKLVRLLPALSKVQAWNTEAKKLPRAVTY